MNNDFNLQETRNNIVAKNNNLIQNSRMSLGLMECKAMMYLISKIQPNDPPGKTYIFNCKEFETLLNWNRNASYQNIKIMFQNIGDKSFWLDSENQGIKVESLVRWFDIVRINSGNGNIEISFHKDMFPLLVDLTGQYEKEGQYFTTFRLQNIALMKNRYSPRIYELLKSYQFNNKKWTFENGTGSEYDLQRRIADTVTDNKTRKSVSLVPKGWKNWAIFKRNVLEPVMKEINRYSDIKVGYAGKKEDMSHKKTRAVRTIEFYMVEKTAQEKYDTDKIIDAEYIEIESEQEISVEEAFFKEHEKKLEEERAARAIFEAVKKEERINNAQYPILYGELCGTRNANFSENKIDQLYRSAVQERVAGEVEYDNWEMFATDLITYYYDKIAATPEDTKTTFYKRLKDSVKNDYDNQAYGIIERYKKRED